MVYPILTILFSSLRSVLSVQVIKEYIQFSKYQEAQYIVDKHATVSPTDSLGFDRDYESSAISYTPHPHAVADVEAQS